MILAALDPVGVIMTVVGLGGLIFFHELGHFVACRLTGTRVEVFSIGFGPKIFGWRRGPTLYKVAAIPLGGYVKMAAENPGEARSDAKDEFPNKSFGQRLFIMSNGVVFNVLLALIFYIWAFGIGVPFPRAEIGYVAPGGAGWEAGLGVGDLVTHVNERRILGFDDLKTEVAFSSKDEVLDLGVVRDGEELRIPVRPRYSEAQGMPVINVDVAWDRSMKGVEPGSPIETAGGKPGDVVLAIDDHPVETVHDLQAVVGRLTAEAGGGVETIDVRVRLRRAEGGEEERAVTLPLDPEPQLGILPFRGNRITALSPGAKAAGLLRVNDILLGVDGRAVGDIGAFEDGASPLRTVNSIEVRRGDEILKLVPETPLTEEALARSISGFEVDFRSNRIAPRRGMPAERAGLRAGDRILRAGSARTDDWEQIRAAVKENGMRPLTVEIERAGGERETLTIQPAGLPRYPTLGYVIAGMSSIHKERSVLGALRTGWDRTYLAMKSVVLTIRSLITRRVSARHVGGPVALAEATYRMLELGWARYLYVLALISINLAILNILPIPVLDGGQIVLLVAEKLRGKPLPDRVVGYLQMLGLALILGLLFLAFHNDIVRLLN
jgi:regulator of sigma E protease